MRTLTEPEVIEECEKIFPKKPLAISSEDLKMWTYYNYRDPQKMSSGETKYLGAIKIIPDDLKVVGERKYYEGIVEFLIRIVTGHRKYVKI